MRPDFGGDLDSGEWTIIALVVHFPHISRVLMFSFNDEPYHRRNILKGSMIYFQIYSRYIQNIHRSLWIYN